MLSANLITKKIVEHLRNNSGLEQHRPYLGISQIAQCPNKLYRDFMDGRSDMSDQHHLYCYAGYLFERDLKSRLQAIGVYKPGGEREVVASFDQRLRGHTDGETTTNDLLEIKSINQRGFDELVRVGRSKSEHYKQVQLYMRYGGYAYTLIVYVCRDTFQHVAFGIHYNQKVADELEEKARRILKSIDERSAPACECNWCGR